MNHTVKSLLGAGLTVCTLGAALSVALAGTADAASDPRPAAYAAAGATVAKARGSAKPDALKELKPEIDALVQWAGTACDKKPESVNRRMADALRQVPMPPVFANNPDVQVLMRVAGKALTSGKNFCTDKRAQYWVKNTVIKDVGLSRGMKIKKAVEHNVPAAKRYLQAVLGTLQSGDTAPDSPPPAVSRDDAGIFVGVDIGGGLGLSIG